MKELEIRNPFLLAAKAGAGLAQRKDGVGDEDILNGEYNHTNGRPGMSLLVKVIIVAD